MTESPSALLVRRRLLFCSGCYRRELEQRCLIFGIPIFLLLPGLLLYRTISIFIGTAATNSDQLLSFLPSLANNFCQSGKQANKLAKSGRSC